MVYVNFVLFNFSFILLLRQHKMSVTSAQNKKLNTVLLLLTARRVSEVLVKFSFTTSRFYLVFFYLIQISVYIDSM